MSIKKPFQLGNLTLPSNIFYAPLAGCSDYPFRQMAARYKPGLMYCEMVKMDAMVRQDKGTFQLLNYAPEMDPIGAQLCGSKPALAGPCAKMIEDLGFRVVDLNCGCPVDKVTKDGSGSGLLKNPEVIGEIVSNMVAAVKIPVTIKVRAGWEDNSINAPLITRIAEEAGAVAICVHGRTREQGYKGPANWDYIKACKEAAKNILVLGNGDLFTADAVQKMFAYTGCDGVVISRGTMGQPWIAEDVYRLFENKEPIERTYVDYHRALLDHFHYTVAHFPERKAILDMRRVGCWYIKQFPGARTLRETINRAQSIDEVRTCIENAHFSCETH